MINFSDENPFGHDPLFGAVEASFRDREVVASVEVDEYTYVEQLVAGSEMQVPVDISPSDTSPVGPHADQLMACREAQMSLLGGFYEPSHARYDRGARAILKFFSR